MADLSELTRSRRESYTAGTLHAWLASGLVASVVLPIIGTAKALRHRRLAGPGRGLRRPAAVAGDLFEITRISAGRTRRARARRRGAAE